MAGLLTDHPPSVGDVVLARVETVGHHTRLHLPDGRRRTLFIGDDVILAYADRYAPSQFEAAVPSGLEACHLVAGGGIAATVTEANKRVRRATRIRPLGLVASAAGEPLNVAGWKLPSPTAPPEAGSIPTLALVGTAMDSGKTTAAAFLARGLCDAGLRVGYAKVTGTAAAGDPTLVADAGADPVLDFTDVGYASTYRISTPALVRVLMDLLAHLQQSGVDAILLEIADGLFQPETAALISQESFKRLVDGVIFAAQDAMGAAAGVSRLREVGHRVLALAGLLEVAPLQIREACAETRLPFLLRRDLANPLAAAKLLEQSRRSSWRWEVGMSSGRWHRRDRRARGADRRGRRASQQIGATEAMRRTGRRPG
jgi:hypothetical protein